MLFALSFQRPPAPPRMMLAAVLLIAAVGAGLAAEAEPKGLWHLPLFRSPSEKAAYLQAEHAAVLTRPLKRAARRWPEIRPAILVMTGCSGSTWISRMLRLMLLKAGVRVTRGHKNELMHPEKNPFYTPGLGIGGALTLMQARAYDANQTLFFKAEPNYLLGPQGLKPSVAALLAMHPRVVLAWRANELDTMVCQVRDCFVASGKGASVDAVTGERTDLCFARRKEGAAGKHNKARLNVVRLAMRLRAASQRPQHWAHALENAGIGAPIVNATYEQLAEFEHEASAPSALPHAIANFRRLTAALGFDVSLEAAQEVLAPLTGTRHPPPSHRTTIFNFDEVQAALAQPGAHGSEHALLRP
ncbi:hypothetical protein T492DRAFT_984327 [Pavlovales sp. CCMP2436]|nr:hypothetical protein T492DRAFT_984327 [Pavlovales sp. CCMP2436]